jgi:hypothetical protein
LRELERVLRRGGLAVVLDHDAGHGDIGRWFVAGLQADGIAYEPDAVARFWARHGFTRHRLDVRWTFADRAALADVLHIEFHAEVVRTALAEVDARGGGWDVTAGVNLWSRRY